MTLDAGPRADERVGHIYQSVFGFALLRRRPEDEHDHNGPKKERGDVYIELDRLSDRSLPSRIGALLRPWRTPDSPDSCGFFYHQATLIDAVRETKRSAL